MSGAMYKEMSSFYKDMKESGFPSTSLIELLYVLPLPFLKGCYCAGFLFWTSKK
jgi:hypothetical protein